MRRRLFFLMGLGLYAQEALLSLADSLAIYSAKPEESLALYDSVLRMPGLPSAFYLRAYVGSLRPLIRLRKYVELYSRADTAEGLALRTGDSLQYAEVLSTRGEALARQNKYAAAETLLQKAISIMEGRYSSTAAYALALHRVGLLRYLQRKYEEAENWYKSALDVWGRVKGPNHPEYAATLNNLAVVYHAQGRYTEAEKLFLEAKMIRARLQGTDHSDYVATLNNLALVYYMQRRYSEAEKLYLEVREIRARGLGTDHPDYVSALDNLALVYYAQRRYAEAEKLYLEAKAIRDRVLGTNHPDYASMLNNLASVYEAQGRYAEAEKLHLEAKAIRARLLGTNHPDYATTLHNLASIYKAQGRYAEAEKLYLEVKEIWARVLGTDHPNYASALNNLALVYFAQGRYTEAEKLLLEVRAIQGRTLGTGHPDYAGTLNNLANVYSAQGRYIEAERLYLETKAIRAQVLGTDHPDYLSVLNNLANVYSAQGRYAEAEKLYLEVRDLRARVLGTDHLAYATTLNNLASMYVTQGRYTEAEKLYLEAKAIRAQVLGTDHPTYLSTLHNLAGVYDNQGRYVEAEKLYLQVKTIRARVLGTDHPDYASTLHNLALVYSAQGRYAEAESLYLEAKAIQEQVLGTEHPDYSRTLYNIANLYTQQGFYGKADTFWRETIQKAFALITKDFLYLPTAHRQQLLENLLLSRIWGFQRYVAQRQTTAFIEQGYRVARSIKGLLLSSTEAMKWLVEGRKSDTTLQRLYGDWRRLSEQYAAFAMRDDYKTADSLFAQASAVERDIIQRLPELKAFFPDLVREPLYPPLGKGEIAIEVVRVPFEKSDSVLYLFYLVEGKGRPIRLYVHRVDSAWERQATIAYEILCSPVATVTGTAYQLLWSFIDSLLPRGTKVIYFSPDGIYYRVNIASLYDGQRYLIDRYDVRYLATTRRLFVNRPKLPTSKPVVIGNPDFGGQVRMGAEVQLRSYRTFLGGIPPLPGAEEEARRVAAILGTEAVTGAAATEEFVKGLSSPQVLHIATHGYFMGTGKAPMLEGGILLAQAALWDSLYPPLGVEDGRLTAQEAATLNLLGTDLVVLSACETGLGEVRGEGLYGLQRAFLESGAKRTITALWQIDDEATRELMESFYRRWWRQTSVRTQGKKADAGQRIDAVFIETLRGFRQKYPAPYYWGAFVLMR